MTKRIGLNLLSVGLAILAVVGTILGGMVLAFDKSLWPIDGYVLYLGQICLVLVIPTSLLAIFDNCMISPRRPWGMLCTQVLLFVLAITALTLTYQGMFVYGWWPS